MRVDYKRMLRQRRQLLKAYSDQEEPVSGEAWRSDQQKGIPPPPLEKPHDKQAKLIDLVAAAKFTIGQIPLRTAIANRASRREFARDPLTLEELSFLLWATQGVRKIDRHKVWTRRAVPSGGARQPYETYLLIRRVLGVKPGIYRYLPLEHKILVVAEGIPPDSELNDKAWPQEFITKAAVVFVWAAVPYRSEWRYGIISYKDILIEAGHICQNLYLACEAIGASTCAIASYDQEVVDALIGVDGEDEMTVYLSPVGKVTEAASDE